MSAHLNVEIGDTTKESIAMMGISKMVMAVVQLV